jgi:hypothetical protein
VILLLSEVLGLFTLFLLWGLFELLVLKGSLRLLVLFDVNKVFTVIRVSLAPV